MNLDKLFHLKENHTDVKTEVMAGITTFMTMAYILAVNPNILEASGMDRGAVFTATALSSFIATCLMAALSNYPFVLAPGMGLNAYFAYTVVLGMGYSWQQALAAVFVEGLIFIVLSVFNVREAIFKKVLNLDTSEIKNFSTSSLITRTTNDITQVEMLIGMGLQLMIKAPITAAWAITKILGKSLEWSMATAVAVIILITTIIILMIIVMPRFKIVQNLIDKINSVTRENLTGIRVVRAFNAEKYQEDKFNKVNNDLTNTQMFNQKTFNILSPMMNIVMHTLTLSIYFIGALLIDKALMGDKIVLFGDMIVFSSYAMQVIMSFLMLAMIFMMLPRANVSAKRINEVLDTEVTIEDGKVTKNKNGLRGTVEFKNVSFKYPDADEYILENISFTVTCKIFYYISFHWR